MKQEILKFESRENTAGFLHGVRLFIVVFGVCVFALYGETYRIGSVQYKIIGRTKESALSQKVRIDRTRIFNSAQELEHYIGVVRTQLKSQRVFDYAEISESRSAADETGLVIDTLLVEVHDTRNFIAFPYPSYDSNSGFSMKLKAKDYNFLGTMQPLSASLFYEPDIDTFDRVTDRRLGGDSAFDLPFSLFSHEAIWTNRADTAWVFNRSLLTFDVQEGLEYYAVDTGRFKWGPYVSAALDRNDTDSEGGESSVLSFGQKVITEQITWTGNYRTGYLANVCQSFDYNLPQNIWSVSVSVESQVHKSFSYMGISTRQYAFYNTNGIRLRKQGIYVRGIRDTDIRTDMMAAFSFDFPVKLFSTDWNSVVHRTGHDWTWPDIFDFEMQLSPFIDVSVGHNYETGSYFNPKDGWYGCGFEILGYLNKWRSVQGRISLGFDAAQLLEKTDTRNRFTHYLFNTDWRTGPLYELNIGIGLFY